MGEVYSNRSSFVLIPLKLFLYYVVLCCVVLFCVVLCCVVLCCVVLCCVVLCVEFYLSLPKFLNQFVFNVV